MIKHYDVYIHSEAFKQPLIRTVRATDPDAAIYRCEVKGDLIPQKGDRVVRCVEVNREGQSPSMHGHLS